MLLEAFFAQRNNNIIGLHCSMCNIYCLRAARCTEHQTIREQLVKNTYFNLVSVSLSRGSQRTIEPHDLLLTQPRVCVCVNYGRLGRGWKLYEDFSHYGT